MPWPPSLGNTANLPVATKKPALAGDCSDSWFRLPSSTTNVVLVAAV